MNDEVKPSLGERLQGFLRPYFLVALVVAFALGAGASTLLADTQNKVEAAYSSGLEEGQSAAEVSYNSQLAEKEEAFSSQLAQQEEDYESQVQAEYNGGRSEGLEEGYAQGQKDAQAEISRLEETIADYEKKLEERFSSQNGGATGYSNSAATNTYPSYEEGSDSTYDPAPQGGTVYWTPNGKSYHSTQNCTTLKRSKTILSGTVSEAIASGHADPCNVCVG